MNDELVALEKRLRVLEDRAELRELVARYGVAVDDRDIAALTELFTPDGAFRSVDGVMSAVGRDAVIEQFHGRFAALQATNHIAHDQILDFAADPDAAEGLVTSHAEVCRHDRTFVAALRYRDRYSHHEGRWRFFERCLSFLYYLPVEEYAEGFAGRLRMRAYGDRRPADYPESLPVWRRYHRED
ncbi:MAG TPA: nuclear transport factor 2 family protein [Steroidobacteraceae bacterium]|nr:nuclear transport factor 2 family protein [Steroidobacteraceae bacterium]